MKQLLLAATFSVWLTIGSCTIERSGTDAYNNREVTTVVVDDALITFAQLLNPPALPGISGD